MRAHQGEFLVEVMSTVLGASSSGFYGWLVRDHAAKAAKKNALIETISKVHVASRGIYGSPRVFKALQSMGSIISKATVERVMRENKLKARASKKYKETTDSKHSNPVAETSAARAFDPGVPNKLWCADITYLWTDEGWLYLAAVIDAGTRKLIGWATGSRMTKDLVLRALEMAVQNQRPSKGLIHHSDRGSQYTSRAYRQRLWRLGMRCSMSRKGNCWDNAVMESFFHSLKVEWVYQTRYKTRAAARFSIFEYIEVFYNRQRIHSALGYVTPECYERQLLSKCA